MTTHQIGSTEWMGHYAREHPNENLNCPLNHRYATDRACSECGYGIWSTDIKCCHCGAENYCGVCNPYD